MALLIWASLGLVNAYLSTTPGIPVWAYAVLGFVYGSNFGMAVQRCKVRSFGDDGEEG